MFSALSVETRKFIVLVFFSLPIDVFSFLYTVQILSEGKLLVFAQLLVYDIVEDESARTSEIFSD